MKKMLFLILVICLCLTLGACNDDTVNLGDTTQTNGGQPVATADVYPMVELTKVSENGNLDFTTRLPAGTKFDLTVTGSTEYSETKTVEAVQQDNQTVIHVTGLQYDGIEVDGTMSFLVKIVMQLPSTQPEAVRVQIGDTGEKLDKKGNDIFVTKAQTGEESIVKETYRIQCTDGVFKFVA
mgnify:FL=1